MHTKLIKEPQMASNHFVRLGKRHDFQRNLDACKALQLKVKEDKAAGTLEVRDGETKVMWAVRKDSDAWVVGYHRAYFNDAA